jgi:hypothetical protein
MGGVRKDLIKLAQCGVGMLIPIEYFKVFGHSCSLGYHTVYNTVRGVRKAYYHLCTCASQ